MLLVLNNEIVQCKKNNINTLSLKHYRLTMLMQPTQKAARLISDVRAKKK